MIERHRSEAATGLSAVGADRAFHRQHGGLIHDLSRELDGRAVAIVLVTRGNAFNPNITLGRALGDTRRAARKPAPAHSGSENQGAPAKFAPRETGVTEIRKPKDGMILPSRSVHFRIKRQFCVMPIQILRLLLREAGKAAAHEE